MGKKPTEQDFVSTLPNLDALRDDKERAATATDKITTEAYKKACSTKTNYGPSRRDGTYSLNVGDVSGVFLMQQMSIGIAIFSIR